MQAAAGMRQARAPRGAGLGLKRQLMPALQSSLADGEAGAIDFFEVAPENWLGVGGNGARQLAWFSERYPLVAHGLSLSLGGPDPLDTTLLRGVMGFMRQHRIALYTEHLSYCSADGQLYELLPLPFTEQAVRHVAGRIRQVQDLLGRRIAVENASYYVAAPIAEMSELDFIRAVLDEADCDLHLDVNNVYVNSINFGYDPVAFLRGLPGERIVYGHVAGHLRQAPDLAIDTHGAPVIDPVWQLLEAAYADYGVFPTLLERDINLPPLARLLPEVRRIAALQARHAPAEAVA